MAPDRGPRPARVDPAALDLDRHRPLQREPGPDHHHASGTPSPSTRSRPSPPSGMPGRLDLGLRRGLGPLLRGLRGHQPQRASAAATRPSATPPRRPWSAASTPSANSYTGRPVTEPDWYRTLAAAEEVQAGRCATTRTTWRRACWPRCSTPPCNGAGHAAQLLAPRRATRCEKGETEKPYAIVDPREAGRPRGAWRALVEPAARARHRGLARAARPSRSKEGDYPAGTFVVRMDQPYRGYALDLLTPQKYPADKAPYERLRRRGLGAARELRRGGEADRRRGGPRRAASTPVTEAVALHGRASTGDGAVFLVRDTGQEALLAARVRLAQLQGGGGGEGRSRSGGVDYPRGLVGHRRRSPACAPRWTRWRAELGLEVDRGGGRARRAAPRRWTCRAWPCSRPGPTPSRRAGCA